MRKVYGFLPVALMAMTFFTAGCKKDAASDPSETAYNNASFSKGGIMYNSFFSVEAGFDTLNVNYLNIKTHGAFFQCKQCHGFDGLGSNGAYINRAAKTTRPSVASVDLDEAAKNDSYQELFDAIKETDGRRDISFDLSTYDPATATKMEGDKMPNFNQILSDAQIWDLVKYLKEGRLDLSQLYDVTYSGTYPTGTATYTNIGKDGNAANGNAFFTANCAVCHNADGKGEDGTIVGNFIRNRPSEAQHKIRYGQLNTDMIGQFAMNVTQMKDLFKACSDSLTYPN